MMTSLAEMQGFFIGGTVMKYLTSKGYVNVSTQMTGKMGGIDTLSTPCWVNEKCKWRKRSCKGSVCQHCFASRIEYRDNLKRNLEGNYSILSSELLTEEDARVIRFNTFLGRFEAFGDIGSEVHARNYIRIARANPQTRFAVWTKNIYLWIKALRIEGKPENLSVVDSSLYLNKPAIDDAIREYVDHVFTVYTEDYRKEHPELEINCGERHCAACQRCYSQTDEIDYINEKLK